MRVSSSLAAATATACLLLIGSLAACQHKSRGGPLFPTQSPAPSGIEGSFSRGDTKVPLTEARVAVLAGANQQFRILGGVKAIGSSAVSDTGQFRVQLPAGSYTVGVYTVTHARGRLPCTTRNVLVRVGTTVQLGLRCT
jgi:hypothetical protein